MRHRSVLFLALVFLFLVPLAGICAPTPFPEPSSAGALFQDRAFGPLPEPTPTPPPREIRWEEEEPIPVGWRIGGIAVAVLAVVALLYGAVRAWRSSNLFDRQYRFATGGAAALRFGATRCGGHMATIRFGSERRPAPSETKDA